MKFFLHDYEIFFRVSSSFYIFKQILKVSHPILEQNPEPVDDLKGDYTEFSLGIPLLPPPRVENV